MPSSVSISCASVGDDFDFEAPLLGEEAKYFTNVGVHCERLTVKLGLLFDMLVTLFRVELDPMENPRAFEGVDFECIGGR